MFFTNTNNIIDKQLILLYNYISAILRLMEVVMKKLFLLLACIALFGGCATTKENWEEPLDGTPTVHYERGNEKGPKRCEYPNGCYCNEAGIWLGKDGSPAEGPDGELIYCTPHQQ